MEITLESIIGILGLLLGGGCGGFFTWKYQREKAKFEAFITKAEAKEKEAEAKSAEIEMALPADARRQAEGGGRQPPADC